MVDQELDALLVGALYGELEPADEARLAAHLESHPTDRTALDDLRSTRKTLLDSRFFELHFDPPAQVSALLVQEAARRAPRAAESGDGWFMRFVRMFALHPAMAAAATLVLVVGVAGTLYMKKGADLAEPKAVDIATAPAVATRLSMGSSAEAPGDLAQGETKQQQAIGNADGIRADLDDKSVVEKSRAIAKNDDQPVAAAKPDYRSAPKGIVVSQHEPQPKDLDHASSNGAAVAADDLETPAYKTAKASPPPSPPPPPPATVATTTPAPVANVPAQAPVAELAGDTSGAGGAAGKKQAADPEAGWARDQHRRVVALVANGRCTDAAPVAAEIQARAPDYYGAYVATDRALKQCQQYIANAVEKQQAQRAKAAKAKAARETDTK